MLSRSTLSSVCKELSNRSRHANIFTGFRQSSRPVRLSPRKIILPSTSRFQPVAIRFLSSQARTAIDEAVAKSPVVLFMKGTPETPQCGFSRASIQILGLQGVDPKKFTAYNVLEDEGLRQGRFTTLLSIGQ